MPLLKFSRDRLSPALEEPLDEVSLEDWCENSQGSASAGALVISNNAPLADIAGDLNGFSVIVLDFPAFKDGRAYSQARLLRQRYGYTGEIRARGEVLRDQLLYMVRCGIDAFEYPAEDVSGAQEALREFSLAYQYAADDAKPIWRKRLARAAAA